MLRTRRHIIHFRCERVVDPRLKLDDFGDCGESPTIVVGLLEAVLDSDEGIETLDPCLTCGGSEWW